jgi:hypothetical protein
VLPAGRKNEFKKSVAQRPSHTRFEPQNRYQAFPGTLIAKAIARVADVVPFSAAAEQPFRFRRGRCAVVVIEQVKAGPSSFRRAASKGIGTYLGPLRRPRERPQREGSIK